MRQRCRHRGSAAAQSDRLQETASSPLPNSISASIRLTKSLACHSPRTTRTISRVNRCKGLVSSTSSPMRFLEAAYSVSPLASVRLQTCCADRIACLCRGSWLTSSYTDILTLKAVSQDEFEDVPVPDRPTPTAGAPHMSANKSAGSTSVAT